MSLRRFRVLARRLFVPAIPQSIPGGADATVGAVSRVPDRPNPVAVLRGLAAGGRSAAIEYVGPKGGD